MHNTTKDCLLLYPGLAGVLIFFFNLALHCDVYPTAWKWHQATLISKRDKDLGAADNCRPITVAPLLIRLYSGLMSATGTAVMT